MPGYKKNNPQRGSVSDEYERGETQEAGAETGGDAVPGDYTYETVPINGRLKHIKRSVQQYRDYGEEHEQEFEKDKAEEKEEKEEKAASKEEIEFDYGPSFYGDPYKGEEDGEIFTGFEESIDEDDPFR